MSALLQGTPAATIIAQEQSRDAYPSWTVETPTGAYRVRHVPWLDTMAHLQYQRLRGHVFVGQLGWDVALEMDGRDCDRYDVGGGNNIAVYTVCGLGPHDREHLLGGVRVFRLRDWDDSMLFHEFHDAKMVPRHVLDDLTDNFAPNQLLELTRLCVRGSRPNPQLDQGNAAWNNSLLRTFDLAVARDLVYSGAYAEADRHGRYHAIAIVDALYMRVMQRSHFVFRCLHADQIHTRNGYALVVIDLAATIQAIRSANQPDRADRMILFCQDPIWFSATESWRHPDARP